MLEHEQQRLQNWRLKILREGQGTRQVAPTCRRYGISRKTFYKWKKRYDQQDWAGLRDRSHAPHRPRAATPPEVVAKILYLRQHYHLGPARISMYLVRYHEIVISAQTIYKILRRHGVNRLPQNQGYLSAGNAGAATKSHCRATAFRSTQVLSSYSGQKEKLLAIHGH
jgi:transposase